MLMLMLMGWVDVFVCLFARCGFCAVCILSSSPSLLFPGNQIFLGLGNVRAGDRGRGQGNRRGEEVQERKGKEEEEVTCLFVKFVDYGKSIIFCLPSCVLC